jgi:molybdopterin-guanine dinucleotide biosynthesis protein A
MIARPTPVSGITGLILAGGRARRMGGEDKGLLVLAGTSLVERCIATLSPHVQQMFISANRHIAEYAQFGFPVLEDKNTDYAGPLAGLQRALEMSPEKPVFVLPCDAPLLSESHVLQLLQRLENAYQENNFSAAIPHDGTRLQPLFGLFAPATLTSLNQYLGNGQRKVETWVTSLSHVVVDCSDLAEAFVNINTEEDLKRAESIMAGAE